jgi:chromosome segregation ATPase
MKQIKKSLMVAAALTTVGAAGLVGTHATQAASDASSNPDSSIVDTLVSKFNLNKADVQKVFDDNRSEMESKREAEVSTRLQKLVDDGTITADQKTKIEAKLKELKAERESNKDSIKDLSDSERKAKMDEKKTELEAWAKENGLDLTKLRGVFMGGGHRGPGGPPPEESN